MHIQHFSENNAQSLEATARIARALPVSCFGCDAGCKADADIWQVSSGYASQTVGHERGTDNVSARQDRLRHVLSGIPRT